MSRARSSSSPPLCRHVARFGAKRRDHARCVAIILRGQWLPVAAEVSVIAAHVRDAMEAGLPAYVASVEPLPFAALLNALSRRDLKPQEVSHG